MGPLSPGIVTRREIVRGAAVRSSPEASRAQLAVGQVGSLAVCIEADGAAGGAMNPEAVDHLLRWGGAGMVIERIPGASVAAVLTGGRLKVPHRVVHPTRRCHPRLSPGTGTSAPLSPLGSLCRRS